MLASPSTLSSPREPPNVTDKLRILCLHGYRGSGPTLRAQMASLASALEPFAEFVYVDAPSLAEGDYGWWHAVENDSPSAPTDPGLDPSAIHYKGWSRTRDAIISIFEREGPFDGVFGFSQGAALASLLVGLRSPDGRPTRERPLAFDFALMVGGFASRDPAHASLYKAAGAYDLPSVHIIGRSDGVVPNSASFDLASRFKTPLILQHDGGHVIASDSQTKAQVKAFFEARLQSRRARSRSATTHAEALEVPLWPGSTGPAMRVFLPRGDRTKPVPALIVLRGGGYATSSGSGGGSAEWAAARGMVGIEVPYRTRAAQGAYPAGYADAARALRLTRLHAAAWGVDAKHIGALGYSAGGHLASLLSTQPEHYVDPNDDLAAHWSARPDFVALAYPVISFIDGYAPGALAGSTENFFGRDNATDAQRRQFSSELHVKAGHPPVFLWTTNDDPLVPSTHAKLFADACRRAGVPLTFRVFPHGAHGLGLALNEPTEVATWTTLFLEWLDAQGVTRAAPSKRPF